MAARGARVLLETAPRLAPLLETDGEKIKLMNSLLLSMPGSPIIYYGDELGMGDNVYLGDRNGVRTPMLFAKRAMLLPATFLGDPFIKGDHLPLRGVARLGCSLWSISDLIGWEGSFDAFKGFQ